MMAVLVNGTAFTDINIDKGRLQGQSRSRLESSAVLVCA